MNKLFQLKDWLSIAEAAQYLSLTLGEKVEEHDVLRLGLDRRLQLSVYFVNQATARYGKVVQYPEAELRASIAAGKLPEELEWKYLPLNIFDESNCKYIPHLFSLKIGDDRYLNFENEVKDIEGVWRLPMIGNERIDVEDQYQMLTGGPEVTLTNIDGTFVENLEGQICQLQDVFDKYKLSFKERMGLKEDEKLTKEQLNQWKEDFLHQKDWRNKYFPAGGLPPDSILVVQTDDLREFEQSIKSSSRDKDGLLGATERNTLLVIIAALCKKSSIDPLSRGAAKKIADLVEHFGAKVTDDTIRKVLAKISDAIDARSQ